MPTTLGMFEAVFDGVDAAVVEAAVWCVACEAGVVWAAAAVVRAARMAIEESFEFIVLTV